MKNLIKALCSISITAASVLSLGCAHVGPDVTSATLGSKPIELKGHINRDLLKDAAMIIIVDKDGKEHVLNPNGRKAKNCTSKPNSKRTCVAYKKKQYITDVETATTLITHGSPMIITRIDAFNNISQTCFDPKPPLQIDCNTIE